jgi:3-hydroxyacyl-[acyl-carrier-protein] dehydratase
MKTPGDFFTILETDEADGKLVSRIALNREHIIYSVHFPGHPITPGVIILQLVEKVLENQLNMNLNLKSLRSCKFTEILNPHSTPELTINAEFKYSEGLLDLKATGTDSNKSYFSFSAVYQVV